MSCWGKWKYGTICRLTKCTYLSTRWWCHCCKHCTFNKHAINILCWVTNGLRRTQCRYATVLKQGGGKRKSILAAPNCHDRSKYFRSCFVFIARARAHPNFGKFSSATLYIVSVPYSSNLLTSRCPVLNPTESALFMAHLDWTVCAFSPLRLLCQRLGRISF